MTTPVVEHAGKEDDESLQGWLQFATRPEHWTIDLNDVSAADWWYEMISDSDQLTYQNAKAEITLKNVSTICNR